MASAKRSFVLIKFFCQTTKQQRILSVNQISLKCLLGDEQHKDVASPSSWDEGETCAGAWDRVKHVPRAPVFMRRSKWVHGGLQWRL